MSNEEYNWTDVKNPDRIFRENLRRFMIAADLAFKEAEEAGNKERKKKIAWAMRESFIYFLRGVRPETKSCGSWKCCWDLVCVPRGSQCPLPLGEKEGKRMGKKVRSQQKTGPSK